MSGTVTTPALTAGSMIARTLRIIGVGALGQTPQAADLSDALAEMNDMLAQWQRKRWMVYHLVDLACVSTDFPGYLIGPGQQFNCARQDKIEGAYARYLSSPEIPGTPIAGEFSVLEFDVEFSSADFPAGTMANVPWGYDWPLYVCQSREEWSNIRLKRLVTFPQVVFYDSAFPNGTLFVWPQPPAGQFEIHIIVKEQLQAFGDTTVPLNMPPEYASAIIWNLACRLAPSYGQAATPDMLRLASSGLATIRNANTQVPNLSLPISLTHRRGSALPAWVYAGGFV